MRDQTINVIVMVVKQYLQTNDFGQLKEDLETVLEDD